MSAVTEGCLPTIVKIKFRIFPEGRLVVKLMDSHDVSGVAPDFLFHFVELKVHVRALCNG